MNHSLDMEKQCTVNIGSATLYITSYEVTRDRRLSFNNCSVSKLHMTDNGAYPAYLKLNGYVMKSECPAPGAVFWELTENNSYISLTIENTFFYLTRIKKFSVDSDIDSGAVKCSLLLGCYGLVREKEEA